MCNLYSMTKNQAAIIAIARALRDITGNLPILPGIFPDYMAPVVRNAPDGVRELAMLRWGMPSSQKAQLDAATREQLGPAVEITLLVVINFAFFACGMVTMATGARLVRVGCVACRRGARPS